MPALANSTSTRPNRSTVLATIAVTCAPTVTSVGTASVSGPSSSASA